MHNPPKSTSSVHHIHTDKPPFGSRFLTNDADVWSQNAWDHVPPPTDQDDIIAASLTKQRSTPVPVEDQVKYNDKPARHWDNFYKANASNFFRNRKWLHNEFPELVAATQAEAGPKVIAEIGCGAGNSVFPLLSSNENPELVFKAYDYSNHAVKLVQTNPLYTSPPKGSINASVWDVTSKEGIPSDIQPGTVDIVLLVFVMSALHPDEWVRAVQNIHQMLKPGGLAVMRDYGRYDLTQLRFKTNRMLDENFYIRGDKTRVYFFELDELALLFTGSKALKSQTTDTTSTTIAEDEEELQPTTTTTTSSESESNSKNEEDLISSLHPLSITETEISETKTSSTATFATVTDKGENENENQNTTIVTNDNDTEVEVVTSTNSNITSTQQQIHPNLLNPNFIPNQPLFKMEQLGVDRRLLINRKRQLKMYRVWMQGKFRKN